MITASLARRCLLFAGLAGLTSCAGDKKNGRGDGDGGGDAGLVRTPVEVVAVVKGAVTDGITGAATVEARDQVTLTVQSTGTVAALATEEGETVQKGQLLARIDLSTTDVDLSRARSASGKAADDLEIAKRLGARGLVPAQQIEDLSYQDKQATFEVSRLKRELGRRRIVSPMTGVVVERHLRQGEPVAPGAPAFVIADMKHLEVGVRVSERHLSRLRPGLPAEVRAEGVGGGVVQGRVARIAPTVDARTGTIKVTVDLGEGRAESQVPPGGSAEIQLLRPGMYVNVRIVVDTSHDALLVPKRAVVYEDDRHIMLYRHVDGIAQKVQVELGYDSRTHVAVKRGIALGDEVIVLGQSGLKDGAEVKVVHRLVPPVEDVQ